MKPSHDINTQIKNKNIGSNLWQQDVVHRGVTQQGENH